MAGFGDDAENELLDLVASGVAYTKGPALRVSLHTGDPGESGAANEVAGGSYARQAVAWAAASGGSISPTAPVDFDGMPATTVTHFGVWTVAGEFRGGGTCTNKTLLAGDIYRLNTTTTWTLD